MTHFKPLEIRFNKAFFSRILHVPQRHIHYALMKCTYGDSVDCFPVLRIDGIKNYYYNIEFGKFVSMLPETELIDAKATRSRNYVTLSGGDIRVSIKLVPFYRHYMVLTANALLYRT